MKATYRRYILQFRRPSGTSRGVMTQKESWFLVIEDSGKKGIGECGILRGLSYDDVPDYEEKLKWVCDNIHLGRQVLWESLELYPSIQFGVEQAFISLTSLDAYTLFPSAFTKGEIGIPINGLIWMGEKSFMKAQIEEKLKTGFSCIKLKIGAIDFESELDLLKYIRDQFPASEIEIRVDANGAFAIPEALEKLKRLSDFELHSIEQPIKAGNIAEMAELCVKSPLAIALDEELIGVSEFTKKEKIIKEIKPPYIILKPSLIGGYRGSDEWIHLAESHNTGWWITSALESNIGLNAIAQYTYTLKNSMPQGLGTGGLYTNNFQSPLFIEAGALFYNEHTQWQLPTF